MDAGVQLLSLINARVAKGEDRRAAQYAVFREHRELVADWHNAGEPQEHEMTTYPGDVLLRLTNSYVALGMDLAAAERRTMREHPHVARAHHLGIAIQERPRVPAWDRGMRRLAHADERLRPGETLLHRCSMGPDGGFFAVMGG